MKEAARGFFFGLACIPRGAALVLKTPPLRRLALLPALIAIVTLLGLGVAVFPLAPWLTAKLWAQPAGWLLSILWWLLCVVLGALVFAIGALTLPGIFSAPVLSRISEVAEAELTGAAPGDASSALGSVVDELGKVAVLLAVHALLLGLALVPVVGPMLHLPLSLVWTALWAAADKLSDPVSRRGGRLRALRVLMRGHLGACLGLGAGICVLLLLPVINVLFEPVAVVAAVRLYLDITGGPDDAPAS